MSTFSFERSALSPAQYRELLMDSAAGACASFEGWVRNHNDGRRVLRLEYEAYEPLGVKEGERIIDAAKRDFGVDSAYCVHRLGPRFSPPAAGDRVAGHRPSGWLYPKPPSSGRPISVSRRLGGPGCDDLIARFLCPGKTFCGLGRAPRQTWRGSQSARRCSRRRRAAHRTLRPREADSSPARRPSFPSPMRR